MIAMQFRLPRHRGHLGKNAATGAQVPNRREGEKGQVPNAGDAFHRRRHDHRMRMATQTSFVEFRTMRRLKRASRNLRNMQLAVTWASQRNLRQGDRFRNSSGHRTLTFMRWWRTEHSVSGDRGFWRVLVRLLARRLV